MRASEAALPRAEGPLLFSRTQLSGELPDLALSATSGHSQLPFNWHAGATPGTPSGLSG